MKFSPAFLLALLIPIFAHGQVPTKHPLTPIYPSGVCGPALSAQAQWKALNDVFMNHTGNVNPGESFFSKHEHVELTCARPYRKTNLDEFTVEGQVVLFHTTSRVSGWVWGNFVSKIEWIRAEGNVIQTGPYGAPLMIGDINSAKTFPFKVTFNPRLAPGLDNNPGTNPLQSNIHDISVHGWYHMVLSMEFSGDNGAIGNANLVVPYFSSIDETANIEWWNNDFSIGATASINMPGLPTNVFGTSIAYLNNVFIPIGPLTETTIMPAGGSTYNFVPDMPLGQTQVILDADFHNGVPGTIVLDVMGHGSAGGFYTLNPALLGTGAHKVAMFWRQRTDGGVNLPPGFELTSVFLYTVTVGNVAPTEVCGDGIDNDGDGLIDEGCVITPPPSLWQTISGFFQTLGEDIRLCRPDLKCTDPIHVH